MPAEGAKLIELKGTGVIKLEIAINHINLKGILSLLQYATKHSVNSG